MADDNTNATPDSGAAQPRSPQGQFAAPQQTPPAKPAPAWVPSAQDSVPMARFNEVNEAKKAAEARIAELQAAAERAALLEQQIASLQTKHAQDLALQQAATTAPHLAHPEVQDLFRGGYSSYRERTGEQALGFSEWLASDTVKASPVYGVYLQAPTAPAPTPAAAPADGQPAAATPAPTPTHTPPASLNSGALPTPPPADPYSPAAIDARLAQKNIPKGELVEMAKKLGLKPGKWAGSGG